MLFIFMLNIKDVKGKKRNLLIFQLILFVPLLPKNDDEHCLDVER